MTTNFCIDAIQEALHRYGKPEIFNTDQGGRFTSMEFTKLLTDNGTAIRMDGKGAWRDNVFIERLWKSIKYEEVYLHPYGTVSVKRRESSCIYFTTAIGPTKDLAVFRRMRSNMKIFRGRSCQHSDETGYPPRRLLPT